MKGIVTFKAMLGRHKRGAFMLATIALALILGLSAYYKQASITNTGVSESVSTNNELSDRIKELVKGLEYPDKVAEDFTRMAMEWKDEQRRSVLIRWKVELSNAHQDYKERKITRNQIVKIEENILREFFKTIRMQFSYNILSFELSDIIENQQANCLSFSQLMYVTWNAVGLSVRPIDVLDPFNSPEGGIRQGHIACIVDLFDGRSVMADVSLLFEIPSRAFKLEDQFVKVGNYWELKDKDNPLLIHRRIRLLDRKGLIAAIADSRGNVYASEGEYDRAILEHNKAIENDPGEATAYFNRGNSYVNKGEYDRAILDYTKAIEIDPRFAEPYYNRGKTYENKGEYDRAILDYTKAIEINPKYTDAYNNRGSFYADRGEYDRAILDFTIAIGIDPKDFYAYNNRGITYADEGKFDRAILDYTKAIEIDPGFDVAYNNRGNVYADKGEYERAILDFTKAIEIDPEGAIPFRGRGAAYAELGKSEEAKKDLRKALELDPELRESVNKVSEQYELNLKLD
ncbi:tetratricopeptide repeat protein [Planctomycetota bacterium]